VLLATGTLNCTLSRWSWRDADAPGVVVAQQTVHLPPACSATKEPVLLAALARDVVVLEDDRLLHAADLTAQTWSSTPKPGDGGVRVVVSRGRALVFVGNDSGVVRIDGEGARAWTTEHVLCAEDDTLVVSPAGEWIVRTCSTGIPTDGRLPGFADLLTNRIVRISPMGVEQYVGAVSLRPLAVDDRGVALLTSHDDSGGEPRGLFVLDAAGELSRIDELEPTPDTFNGAIEESPSTYFSAQAVP
jgi:hypothetical protein